MPRTRECGVFWRAVGGRDGNPERYNQPGIDSFLLLFKIL